MERIAALRENLGMTPLTKEAPPTLTIKQEEVVPEVSLVFKIFKLILTSNHLQPNRKSKIFLFLFQFFQMLDGSRSSWVKYFLP